MDYLTKFPEAFALPDQTVETIAKSMSTKLSQYTVHLENYCQTNEQTSKAMY